MARPRKPEDDKRKRWDALHVTDAQRAEITAAAKAAGQSASQYLLAAHRGVSRRPARDRSREIQALVQAERHLDVLARAVTTNAMPIDAVMLQANLLSVERAFRLTTLPWSVVPDDAQEGTPAC